MKTPKKIGGSVTPNTKSKKPKLDTPMPEKIISQKLETPKSGKKNKQKEAQTPKESNQVKEKIETPTIQTKGNKTPKAKTPKHIQNGKSPEIPKVASSNKKKNIASNNTNENIIYYSPIKKGKENLKNSKKRPLEEDNSVNKKAKGETNKEQAQSITQKSESDEIVISFPPGAKCYKSVLKQILDMSHEVSSPRSLIISFKNPEEAKKKIPQLKKLKVGEENITVVPFEDENDPLKRVAVMRFHDADPEEVQKAIGAVSCSQLVSNYSGKSNGIYIFKFNTKEAADEAESKNHDVNGKSITLRKYFVDQNTKEEPIVTEGKKRKLDQLSAAPSTKQSKTVDKDDDDDEEDDDDDEEEEEEEDEDDEEAAAETAEVEGEEEEDDDDEEEEEDDDDDDDDDE